MKSVIYFILIVLMSVAVLAQEDKKDDTKIFDFDAADISGNKTKPAGSRVDSLKSSKTKTEVKPREDFLPELSSSVDEL